jgi:hypothetical protein
MTWHGIAGVCPAEICDSYCTISLLSKQPVIV